MILTESLALSLVRKIIAVAVLLQTVELLALRETMTEQGVWSWSILKEEFEIFPLPLQRLLNLLLSYPNFLFVLLARLLASVLIFFMPLPLVVFVLLFTTMLISLRWRGTFNGGSDFMTLIVLLALSLATAFGDIPGVARGCLWYISIQACTSYFIGGLVKLKRANWRCGLALPAFLNSAIYEPSRLLNLISINRSLALLASWLVMTFECTFPVALFRPHVCLLYIGAALLFHLANVYAFGLNRFLFAWAAAYPALYFCSQGVGLR